MKLLPLVFLTMMVGCSKATVPVSLSGSQGAQAQTIELKHEKDGWVAVEANTSNKIPKGQYTAVRATFMAQGKETTKGFGGGDRPAGNQGRGMVEYKARTKANFCAKGKKNNDVTIKVRQATPTDDPSIQVGKSPACK